MKMNFVAALAVLANVAFLQIIDSLLTANTNAAQGGEPELNLIQGISC